MNSGHNLPQQIKSRVPIQRCLVALAALLRFGREVLLPHIWRIFALAAVFGDARAYAADDRRVDRGPGDDNLAFGERWQVAQQIAAYALDGCGNALLVDLIDDAHDALCLALAEHVGVELAGPLADQCDPNAEFAALS